jgi:glycosyltransferase involved in cell wall biosynthesis
VALDSDARETLIQIIGIVLVRNEDLFIRRAIENILGFCDLIILADNASTDDTAGILQELEALHPKKLQYHRIDGPDQSHGLIEHYAGSNSWIFAVDGDEIYDPHRLASLRQRLRSGEFANTWMLMGNVLHCTFLDPATNQASGFLAPPSRSVTKLYNFSAIHSWKGPAVERLHGGTACFRDGYSAGTKRKLNEEFDWEESPFRCLHMCFLRRSTTEPENPGVRENIMELRSRNLLGAFRRKLNRLLGQPADSPWKREYYCRGPRVTVETQPFFSS